MIKPANCSGHSKPLTLEAMSLGWGLVQLDVSIVNTASDRYAGAELRAARPTASMARPSSRFATCTACV